jgi:peptide/nickel transport system permease protein
MSRLLKNPIALVGLIIIVLYVLITAVSQFWLPFDPLQMDVAHIMEPPSFKTGHLFGTDEFGRDILTRIMKGAGVSLLIAISATLIGATIGTFMGVWAGFLGGAWDHWIMRFADVLFSFPSLLLAIFVMAILGEKTYNVIIAISIVYIPQFARVSRGAVLAIKNNEFVRAAFSSGADRRVVVYRPHRPNNRIPTAHPTVQTRESADVLRRMERRGFHSRRATARLISGKVVLINGETGITRMFIMPSANL